MINGNRVRVCRHKLTGCGLWVPAYRTPWGGVGRVHTAVLLQLKRGLSQVVKRGDGVTPTKRNTDTDTHTHTHTHTHIHTVKPLIPQTHNCGALRCINSSLKQLKVVRILLQAAENVLTSTIPAHNKSTGVPTRAGCAADTTDFCVFLDRFSQFTSCQSSLLAVYYP